MISSNDLVLLLHMIDTLGKVEGRKRLQKMVCIAKTRDKIPFTFHFKPYFYGPYSEELSDSINSLCGAGLVEEKLINMTNNISQYQYFVTEKGREVIKGWRGKLQDSITKLASSVESMNPVGNNELVKIAKQLSFD